jgi:prevent-host-death family protein
MHVSLAEAQSHLPELIRAVEDGESVVITRQGKPVAQIGPPPRPERRKVQFDGLRNRIELPPGWDDPVDPDRFLMGEL